MILNAVKHYIPGILIKDYLVIVPHLLIISFPDYDVSDKLHLYNAYDLLNDHCKNSNKIRSCHIHVSAYDRHDL